MASINNVSPNYLLTLELYIVAIFTLFSFCNISLRDQKLCFGPEEYQVWNIKACETVSTVRKKSGHTDKYTMIDLEPFYPPIFCGNFAASEDKEGKVKGWKIFE